MCWNRINILTLTMIQRTHYLQEFLPAHRTRLLIHYGVAGMTLIPPFTLRNLLKHSPLPKIRRIPEFFKNLLPFFLVQHVIPS